MGDAFHIQIPHITHANAQQDRKDPTVNVEFIHARTRGYALHMKIQEITHATVQWDTPDQTV